MPMVLITPNGTLHVRSWWVDSDVINRQQRPERCGEWQRRRRGKRSPLSSSLPPVISGQRCIWRISDKQEKSLRAAGNGLGQGREGRDGREPLSVTRKEGRGVSCNQKVMPPREAKEEWERCLEWVRRKEVVGFSVGWRSKGIWVGQFVLVFTISYKNKRNMMQPKLMTR